MTIPVFQKAIKAQSKLRCAIFGPSGSGKTYSALAIASGLGDRIALIDTEHFRSSSYADQFDFNVINLTDTSIEDYLQAILVAIRQDCDVLIIDSLTHGWLTLLEEVEKIANTKYKGNTWRAWADANPRYNKLIRAIITYPGHIICTFRSKTKWILTENEKTGKVNVPTKVGMGPEFRANIEYEFLYILELTEDHFAMITDKNGGNLQGTCIEKPGKDFAIQLKQRLNTGANPNQIKEIITVGKPNLSNVSELYNELKELIKIHDINENIFYDHYGISLIEELDERALPTIIAKVKQKPMRKKEEHKKECGGEVNINNDSNTERVEDNKKLLSNNYAAASAPPNKDTTDTIKEAFDAVEV
jgi:hypothetical protein